VCGTQGTNVNARNAKGQTALSVACAHGSPGMAQLLLAHPGIDKRATDNGTHRTARTTPHTPRRTHDTTRTTRTDAFG
jgi:ankyrin repeat protein